VWYIPLQGQDYTIQILRVERDNDDDGFLIERVHYAQECKYVDR